MNNPFAILRHVPPFDAATEKDLADLLKTATTRSVKRANTLWRSGDTPAYFTVIHSGLIKIVRELPNGREAIVGVFGPRESVGEVAVVRGTPYPGAAVVCSDTALLVQIPRDPFLGWLHAAVPSAARMTEALAERLQLIQSKLEILSAGSVESRLAALLLDLAERFGDELEEGSVLIPIALSRQELANLISTSFETVIRVMSRWQKQGVLTTSNDGFLLRDMTLLKGAASTVLQKTKPVL